MSSEVAGEGRWPQEVGVLVDGVVSWGVQAVGHRLPLKRPERMQPCSHLDFRFVTWSFGLVSSELQGSWYLLPQADCCLWLFVTAVLGDRHKWGRKGWWSCGRIWLRMGTVSWHLSPFSGFLGESHIWLLDHHGTFLLHLSHRHCHWREKITLLMWVYHGRYIVCLCSLWGVYVAVSGMPGVSRFSVPQYVMGSVSMFYYNTWEHCMYTF